MKLTIGDLIKVNIRVQEKFGRGSDTISSRVDRIAKIAWHRDGYYIVDMEPTSIKEVTYER